MKIRPLVSKNSNYQVLSETKKDMLECCLNIFFRFAFFLPYSAQPLPAAFSLPSFLPFLPPLFTPGSWDRRKKERKEKEGRKWRAEEEVCSVSGVGFAQQGTEESYQIDTNYLLEGKKNPPIFSLVISCPQVIDTTLFPPPGLQQLRRLRRKRRLLL